jgi:nucleoside-diphosphate-sugar epimerase
MPSLSPASRILVTGGGGFLGRHLVKVLQGRFQTVVLDVQNPEGAAGFLEGSVTDASLIARSMEGVDGLVIGHMAPRAPGVYDTPEIPCDINVKGTALLLEAAARSGVKRVVLISSISVVGRAAAAGQFLSHDMAACPDTIYALTKAMQEEAARFYHAVRGLEIAVLRPAYICLGDELVDKYGRKRFSVSWQFIDPRDIGEAALGAFTAEQMGCEVFHLMAGPGAEEKADISRAFERLGWRPKFRFSEFPMN